MGRCTWPALTRQDWSKNSGSCTAALQKGEAADLLGLGLGLVLALGLAFGVPRLRVKLASLLKGVADHLFLLCYLP